MENLTKTDLNKKIDRLSEYFSKYKNQRALKELKSLREKLDNQEYKIAVVANMSAGKSTFINALFGNDVLPSYNFATTDSATYIYSKPNTAISMNVYFSDGRKPINIADNLMHEIKEYAKKDEDCEDKKYHNVERIELFYPFKNLQTSSKEDFNITFVDTPGPNSTGEGYKEKHKNQTREVLNDVDLALFVSDYGQTDANLESDEQGLWNTIKIRHEKDKNFEVYILLNKIDMAFDDNFKDIGKISREDYIKEQQKRWYINEKKAIDKLIKAAKKHGILEPKIYPISSYYQLLDRLKRNEKIDWHNEDKLENFQKLYFKRIWNEKWEDEYIKYLGIIKLEEDINSYIQHNVKQKIFKKIYDCSNELINEELISLNGKIQTFQKPKEEAERNVKNALDFLDKDAKKLEVNMIESFKKSEKKYSEEIQNLISQAIEDEFYSQVEIMAKIAIAYAESIAFGETGANSRKLAQKTYEKIKLDEVVKLELDKSVDIEYVMKEMQGYIRELFNEYKNNYMDIKTDLKNCYSEYEREISKAFREAKDILNKNLQNELDIEIQNIQMQIVDIDSNLSFNVEIPDSVLRYNYKQPKYKTVSDSTWWNPFTWFSTKTVKIDDEKHILTINPKNLLSSVQENMRISINKFEQKEKENYIDAIRKLRIENSDIFTDFKINKQKEIDNLEHEIKDSEKKLVVAQKQLKDLENYTKD